MTATISSTQPRTSWLATHYPGILIAAIAGICSEAVSRQYGAPPMLIALLVGLAIHFIYEFDKVRPGINWSARSVLRFGVALLGIRISLNEILSIGAAPLVLVLGAMVVTMIVGALGAKMLGLSREFGALSGGSVSVCGASAAAAVASVLPENEESERSLAVVIAVVTLLATVAMIFYPLLVQMFDLTPQQMGVILGGTIHDVAQVVAAGKAISPQVEELSTFVKLMRVAALLPIVMGVYFWLGRNVERKEGAPKVQYIPPFLIAFFVLAALNSAHLVPPIAIEAGSTASHYFLVTAIAAIGVKTDLRSVVGVGWRPFVLLVVETLVMLAIVLGGVLALR